MFHRIYGYTVFGLTSACLFGCAEQKDVGELTQRATEGEAKQTGSPDDGISGKPAGRATTLADTKCSGIEDFVGPAQDAPSFCEWAEPLDTIVLGEIASIEPSEERYFVEFATVEALAPLIRENRLGDDFPWLDELMAIPSDGRESVQLVSSCPDGLREEVPGGTITASVRPIISIKLQHVEQLFGGNAAGDTIEYLVQPGGGLRIDDDGKAVRDGVLEDGTLLGMGLIASPSGTLVQGSYMPFTVSNGVVIAPEACRPTPAFPKGMDGMKLEELKRELQACKQGEPRAESAAMLRARELSMCFSGETGVLCHAARCFLGYSGEFADE